MSRDFYSIILHPFERRLNKDISKPNCISDSFSKKARKDYMILVAGQLVNDLSHDSAVL